MAMASLYPPRIFLTGYMGAGKSTIGRLLAKKLGYGFYDTDRVVRNHFAKPMHRIFKEEGEEIFRAQELRVLQELSIETQVVISAGGGTLTREETISVALAAGVIVYIQAPPEALFERVIFSPKDRPMIDVPNAEQVFVEKFKQREPYYLRSHYTVGSMGRPPQAVVDDIVACLKQEMS